MSLHGSLNIKQHTNIYRLETLDASCIMSSFKRKRKKEDVRRTRRVSFVEYDDEYIRIIWLFTRIFGLVVRRSSRATDALSVIISICNVEML